mgnify:CR=1 FL=1
MGETLPPLILPIVGDATGVSATLARVQVQVQNFGNAANSSMQRAGAAFSAIGSRLSAFGVQMAGAVAAYASFSAVVDSFNRADELGKMAETLGISVEALQVLQIAATQTGGSAQGMANALREMLRTLEQAKNGEEGASVALAKLGLVLSDLQGLGADKAFIKIADALARLDSAQERVALSQEIFGRQSRDISATLTIGAAKFAEIEAYAKKYGLVVSSQDNSKLKEANDDLQMIKTKMEALSSKTALEFTKSIGFVKDEFVKADAATSAWSGTVQILARAFELITAVVFDLIKTIKMMWDTFEFVFFSIATVASRAAEEIWRGFSLVFRQIGNGLDILDGEWDFVVGKIKIALWGVIDILGAKFAAVIGKIAPQITELGDIMKEFGIAGGESIGNLGHSLEMFASDAKGTIAGGMKAAAEQVEAGRDRIEKSMKNMGMETFNAAPGWLTYITDQLYRAWGANNAEMNAAESSIENLIRGWIGVDSAVATSTSGVKAFTEEQKKANAEQAKMKAEYKKFKDEVDKSLKTSQESVTKTDDPLAAEEKRYETQLAMAKKFRELNIADETAYQEQLTKINQTHTNNRYAMAAKNFEEASKHSASVHEKTMQDEMDSLKTLAAVEQAAYEDKLKLEFERDQTEEERQQNIDLLAQQHADNQVAIVTRQKQMEAQAHQNAAMIAANVFGQAAALMDRNNKAQFIAWKVFASGQAVINAFLAYGQVLATPLPDAFGAYRMTMANITLGLGLAAAAKIVATPYGGGGASAGGLSGGAGGGGGGNPMSGAQQANSMNPAQTNVNVSLYGDSFSAEQVRGLIGVINQQQSQNMVVKAN